MKADLEVNQSRDAGRRILLSSIEDRSRNLHHARECPLSGIKQTWVGKASACDQGATSRAGALRIALSSGIQEPQFVPARRLAPISATLTKR
jgi:hypothetical protein